MSNSKFSSSHLAAGIAATGLGLYLLRKAAKSAFRSEARRNASSQFEFHLAVHLDGSSASKPWVLVKQPKSADMMQLREAVASAFALDSAEGLRLYPVQRRGGDGPCAALHPELARTASLETLLSQLPPEQLQIVELVCTTGKAEAPALSGVPAAAPAFPLPGPCLPFIGTTYQLLGPEPIYSNNIANNVFPPEKYPYGATVRSYSGGPKSKVGDFPVGSAFHIDAETMTTWSADAEIVKELIERTPEFPKLWNRPAQLALQDFTGNGLFTSSETSEDWKSAHNLLPRGFNQIKVKSFAPQILSKTRAFVQEWSRFPAGYRLEGVNDWLTAMTADAVVACAMGMDMRNVERLGAGQAPHSFVDTFRFGLGYSTQSITAKSEYGWKRFMPFSGAEAELKARYAKAKADMQKQVEDMVEATRRGDMGGANSVIRSMLQDKTSDGKFVHYGALYGHVVNLMIAGHETTAATLGFTMQLLAEHPEYEARALAEVREVMQQRTEPSVDDVPKLQFVEQCFREALRLYSPVAMLSRDAAHDTLLGGHKIYQGERVNVLTSALHTNPEYWGGEFGDPRTFNPDRFSADAVRKRHPNAYHPWGFSTRACIGSQFALFEAKTFLASMLIHFRLEGVPGYKLVASTHAGGAAPSPKDLAFILHPRPGGPLWTDAGLMQPLPATKEVPVMDSCSPISAKPAAPTPARMDGPEMKVLYGSNTGASQEFASQVATSAGKAGFQVSTCSLDTAVSENLLDSPDGRLVVIITSTYNGLPPDNAVKFKAWLQQSKAALEGLKFAVFGVGNSQWHTYQQFPREVDTGLANSGAQRVCDLGACDVDSASFDSDFDDWLATLLRTIGGAATAEAAEDGDDPEDGKLEFVLEDGRIQTPLLTDIGAALMAWNEGKAAAHKLMGLGNNVGAHGNTALEVVEEARELCQQPHGRSVRHVTLKLPEDHPGYRAGDHLEVLPPNDPMLVASALNALGVDKDAVVRWDPSKTSRKWRNTGASVDERLKTKIPAMHVTAGLVLEWVPDLAAVPGRKLCTRLAHYVTSAEARDELLALGSDAALHKEKVAGPKMSLAELLQRFSGQLQMTIGDLVVLAKDLTPRRYSVSSSPEAMADRRLVTVTVGQVEFTTGTGRKHHGLASTCLGNMTKGGIIPGFVRSLQSNFHLPAEPSNPIIMVGPGTGVAPMMGFLQERESLLKKGIQLGPAEMFFGCRSRDQDYLYQEELHAHLRSGALSRLHVAFSRETEQKVYVQDKIWEQRESVWKLLQNPRCMVYICGDARAMAPDVKQAFQRVAEHCGGKSSASAANMVALMVESGRYVEDVWAA
mmetsp:Transcript_77557/g.136845  ORF Transcript_77557/g.136845 Transcript_77557/m.136845 type:complete len:1320 (-) Transcript_77557:350-4309(-)|eukprot:CAMPEP_0197625116 /NCGR_PEP_ID=MMETSP1338-20131121/4561_1 /TAXON_ID=43686 ORGANISM="Pelagodinium beii, Strain RCC1491" /NCGR_SAMPLE_ID=MMETSP1338 /ASSEMBLY_ACC=CAM_ASM_000754 /LENGTH=1319 /DNA_ID=CAMNT_0043195435 /DNA_START=86 /DNA_END=4045 /DNA_ORIENTATION=-